MTAVLSPGTPVIYTGRIRSEYAESYRIDDLCDCPNCPDGENVRYRLVGAHVLWSMHDRRYVETSGSSLVHVDPTHVVPSPESPQPWQVNWRLLCEMGVSAPDWMRSS
jgi:hypothetical protein